MHFVSVLLRKTSVMSIDKTFFFDTYCIENFHFRVILWVWKSLHFVSISLLLLHLLLLLLCRLSSQCIESFCFFSFFLYKLFMHKTYTHFMIIIDMRSQFIYLTLCGYESFGMYLSRYPFLSSINTINVSFVLSTRP